jgi:hypothetical protein
VGGEGVYWPQTDFKRQATRYDCLPSFQGQGDKLSENSVRWVKKIFWTGPNRAAKAGQKSLVLARKTQRTNHRRTPFKCTLWVPICLSFNRRQGPPLSSISGTNLLELFVGFLPLIRHRLSERFLRLQPPFCQPAIPKGIECKWEGVGPWNGSERSECHLGPKKSICFLIYSLM